jgi:hypothetical protein
VAAAFVVAYELEHMTKKWHFTESFCGGGSWSFYSVLCVLMRTKRDGLAEKMMAKLDLTLLLQSIIMGGQGAHVAAASARSQLLLHLDGQLLQVLQLGHDSSGESFIY